MLTSPDKFITAQQLKQQCGSNRIVQCHIGMGYHGVPCFAPLAGRTSFQMGFIGYTNPDAKPLEKLYHLAVKKNLAILFIGDSVMRQRLQFFECEFKRENPKNRFASILGSTLKEKLPCRTHFQFSIHRADALPVDFYSVAFTELRAKCGVEYNRISHMENANTVLQAINAQNKSALVVFNSGLWWNSKEMYIQALPRMVSWLLDIQGRPGVRNHVTWVETTAQHWASVEGNGYYHSPLATEQGRRAEAANFTAVDIHSWHIDLACRALTAETDLDWRNLLAKEYLARTAAGRLQFFDLNEATERAADLHISHPYKLDCTHYCYAPLLWQPLWHYLVDAAAAA